MAREYFHAYHSFLKSMEELNDAECGRLFRACLTYSMTGEAQKLPGNERILFPTMKGQIDRDKEAYAEKCRKQSLNIRKRWDTTEYDGIPTIPTYTDDTKTKEKEKTKDIPPYNPPAGDEPDGKPLKPTLTKGQEERFQRFWTAYPRKIKPEAARKAWAKIKPDEALTEQIIAGVKRSIAKDKRFRDGFIPHPATWLNAKEWENEYANEQPRAPAKPSRATNHSTRKYTPEELSRIGVDLLEEEKS